MSCSPEEADQVEEALLSAPGALYGLPEPGAMPMDERLLRADQRINRCRWCGAQTIRQDRTCNHCRTTGYPTIF